MITVTISINNKPIYTRTATNISDQNATEKEVNVYHIDTGKKIKHIPDEGCVSLAKKMLDTIKEKLRGK